MFDEELITWSVDGGGRFFFRPKHKFSVTNVCGYMRIKNDKWNDKFVYYSLDFQHAKILFDYQTKAHPSVIRKIYNLREFTKPEQSKIAEILSTVDRAIEQTEALIAKQQRIKTGLMQDLLTRGIDEQGNLRSEKTHKFKDSPLGRIPVEWEVVPFSHYVARLDAGVSVNSDDSPCGSGQIGVLKTSALSRGLFIAEHNKTVVPEDLLRVRMSPKANTILISRMNTPALVGDSAYVYKDYPTLFLPDRIWMSVFHGGKEFAGRWLSYLLLAPDARNYISLNATGTSGSMKNLPKKSMLCMPIRSPATREEIQRITDLLQRHETNCAWSFDVYSKLRSLKTGLMQDLLTGQKRVTALNNATEVGA
jgi:type I restriction enzyme S subunit